MVTCAMVASSFRRGWFCPAPDGGSMHPCRGAQSRKPAAAPYTAPQDVFDGTLPAMSLRMARARGATAREPREPEVSRGTVRVEEECLELEVTSPREINILRRWLGRVNGPAYSQPYLVEGPPGRFRLYVGEAAERVRTRHGIL